MKPFDTHTKLLDVAEKLFAKNGFKGTSLRVITQEAGVNLAAVNYHFGSKERLIREVFRRRVGPVNQRRLEKLDRIEEKANIEGRNPELREILDAFIEPPIQLMNHPSGKAIMRLFSRLIIESKKEIAELFIDQFAEVVERFLQAFHRALPQFSQSELSWKMHFMIGAMAHAMAEPFRLKFLSQGLCDPSDVQATITRLIDFCQAGFLAPVSNPDSAEEA